MRLRTDRLNVLVVCTANRVRSPFAERVFQSRFDLIAPGLVRVASAGVRAVTDDVMDERSALELSRRDIDDSDFVCRPVSRSILSGCDLVLGMEKDHVEDVLRQWPEGLHKTFTLGGFANILERMARRDEPYAPTLPARWRLLIRRAAVNRGLAAGGSRDILDPVRVSSTDFRSTMLRIEQLVDAVVHQLFSSIGSTALRR